MMKVKQCSTFIQRHELAKALSLSLNWFSNLFFMLTIGWYHLKDNHVISNMSMDLVLWLLLVWPLIPYYGCLILIIVLLPFWGLYCLLKSIFNFDCEKLCHSRSCKKLKQFWQNAWKMAKHPQIIILVLKKLILYMKEKQTKKNKVNMAEIFTVESIHDQKKKPKFKFNRVIYFTILLYYSSVFTAIFWPRFVYFYDCCYGGFDINFGLFLGAYILFCIPCCFMFINISSANHLTVADAANYLTGSPECQCFVDVHCYHREGSGDDATTVTTFRTSIRVSIERWMDKGNINMAEITFALNKLMAKKKILQLSPVLQVTPADDKTKKQLKEFRENCIASHKHRDSGISATVIYKMMRHGKQVDDLVVFKEGTTVPKSWLSNGEFCLLFLFFALGTPLAAVVILYCKMNVWKISFKKQIVMKYVNV